LQPHLEERAKATSVKPESDATAKRPSVLVVEDDTGVRTTLCAALTAAGFLTHQAETIGAAMKILGERRVDAVTLDLGLPNPLKLERPGLKLLSYLRTSAGHEHSPVLVFTGLPPSPEDEKFLIEHGARVFQKPQPYNVLVDWLKRAIRDTHV
jgi:DNA-binding response OmpR family regulator